MAKVTADGFAAALAKILNDYKDGVITDTETLTKKFAQKGVKELKSASGIFGGGGGYAKGWRSKFEKKRLGSGSVIYNEKPGLPHLLENGHAKRGGGRVAGRSHIAPVEEKLVEEFTKAIEGAVQ